MQLVFLLCVLAFVLWGFVRGYPALDPPRRRDPQARNCDWTVLGTRSGTLREWRCGTCGITAFSRPPGPPEQCKRGMEGRL